MNDSCKDCGERRASGEDGLCDRCSYARDMSDQMEARGESLEPSARYPQVRGDLLHGSEADWLDEDALSHFEED